MSKEISFLRVCAFGLRFSAGVFPSAFIAYTLVFILQGVTWGILAFVTQHFFDSVGDAISGAGALEQAFSAAFILVGIIFAKEMLNRLPAILRRLLFEKSMGRLNQLMHKKMSRIVPISLEDTKCHDDIEKAKSGAFGLLLIPNLLLAVLAFYPVYFVVMGIYLYHLRPHFLFFMLLVFVPLIVSQFLRTGIIAKLQDKAAPVQRKLDYYGRTITEREYFKETRMLGGYRFFLNRFNKELKALSKEELRANAKTSILELFMGLLSAAGYIGILFMLVRALLAGDITVGAFAAVFGSVSLMFFMMEDMINTSVGGVTTFLGMARNFMRFLDLPERPAEKSGIDISKGIVANNISLVYPQAKTPSINNVSLEIKPGESVAIVGENGAGKTTLVRLLTGLYAPTQGSVHLFGMDTSKTDDKLLFGETSGVFQRYQRYQMTLEENVRISQASKNENVDFAVKQAGVNINSPQFPSGVKTMLSREFDGVDLSGGEWQRVAIARGLYRSHNLIVLDEPTAAIDPLEESRLFQQFVEMSKGKTSIVVTHRLGLTKMADRILVMNKGKLVEDGTHQKLLSAKGFYAKLFMIQADMY